MTNAQFWHESQGKLAAALIGLRHCSQAVLSLLADARPIAASAAVGWCKAFKSVIETTVPY